jgi:hypothetical protein
MQEPRHASQCILQARTVAAGVDVCCCAFAAALRAPHSCKRLRLAGMEALSGKALSQTCLPVAQRRS